MSTCWPPAEHVRTARSGRIGRRWTWSAALVLTFAVLPTFAGETLVKARRVYVGSGPVIENGMVLVRDGKIAAVGTDLAVPAGAAVVDLHDAVLTPGLVDACAVLESEVAQSARNWFGSEEAQRRGAVCPECGAFASRACCPHPPQGHDFFTKAAEAAEHQRRHEAGEEDSCAVCSGPTTADAARKLLAPGVSADSTWAEHSSEVTPNVLVADSLNLLSRDYELLLRSGVTTVFVSPDSGNVIGARGAIVKTGGKLGERVVRSADAVKASLGADPVYRGQSNRGPFGGRASLATRRPTTRMGVDFVFRKAFYDAVRTGQGLSAQGADTAPEAAFPVLRQVLSGEIPLRIQARMQHDIFSALRLANEFKVHFVLEEGTEAYRALDALKAADVPVIYGPLFWSPSGFRAFVGEADEARLNTPQRLSQAGIRFAITAQEFRDEEGLQRQAMMAMRYGLSADEALKSITESPAEIMGLAGRVGRVQPGADADLVAWSGEPLAATSRALWVMVNGDVAFGQPPAQSE